MAQVERPCDPRQYPYHSYSSLHPEMNPIEQIWKEMRKRGFRNEVFKTLEHFVDRLCKTIKNLPENLIQSITGRQWIMDIS